MIFFFSVFPVLPELPVPGPAPHANPNPGSNLLYHRSLVAEASQLLNAPSDALANQVTTLLANTSVDYIQLNEKNTANPPQAIPQNNLANVIYRRNPALLGHLHQPEQQQQWSGHNSYHQSQGNNYAEGSYPNQSGDYMQQQQQYHSQQQQQGFDSRFGNNSLPQNSFSDSNAQDAQQQSTGADRLQADAANGRQSQSQPSNHQAAEVSNGAAPAATEATQNNGDLNKNDVTAAAAGTAPREEIKAESKSNLKQGSQPMLKLSITKLSKEAQDLMLKSGVKAGLKELNTDQVKAEEMGLYDNCTPRSRKTKVEDPGAISDESDGDEPKKARNKFFKDTEKKREEERKKLREMRRKRMLEDGGQDPEEYYAKRRKKEPTPEPPSPEPFVPKKVTRKVERNLIPVIPMVSIDELMEQQNTFKKFNQILEVIFDNLEDINLQNFEQMEEGTEIPPEILIPKYQLADLASETAKLKSRGAMESISSDKLVKLLNILELNIRDGSKVVPLVNDDDQDDELYLETAQERVARASDASLTVLNILTSKKMSKRVYIDDVIDRVALFLRFQLSNTIYPSYDPVYKEISKSKTGYVGSMKKKRSYANHVRDRYVLGLYNKMRELTTMTADLVRMQLLTDTTILHISNLGVTPFFVENIPELQLAALKLVTNLFSKYEKHRKLLLDDILASIARLPSSKRSLRSYQLNPTTHIQMLTALVLQLIQCVVVLPKRLADPQAQAKQKQRAEEKEKEKEKDEDVVDLEDEEERDRDVLVNDRYTTAMATAHQFLVVFLRKCGSKNEDVDYRPLFENFVQDLLTTVNTPEWPAAELLLSLLGRVLRDKFRERGTEMALRISSLEYLGVVAARLRKDAVQSKLKIDYIDSIVKLIKEEEDKDESGAGSSTSKGKKSKSSKAANDFENDPEEERNKFLQRVLLDFLAVSGGEEESSEDASPAMNARHFYICQWYRDVNALGRKPKKKKRRPNDNRRKGGRKGETSSEEESSEEEEDEDEEDMPDSQKSELYRAKERRKDLLLSKIPPFGISKGHKAQVLSTHIDHSSAHLIVKYLSSKRPFFNSFNYYLQDILNVLTEQSTHIRTKALKCMTMIVTEDPEVLLRENMRRGVNYSFTDSSTMVREAAVDLVGKFILHKQELIDQYYKVITDRILVRLRNLLSPFNSINLYCFLFY